MTKKDSIHQINEAIAKINLAPATSELAPIVEALRLIARHLDDESEAKPAPQADEYYLQHEAPEYSGK